MKKIFFLFYLTVNLYSYDNQCCSSGETSTCSMPNSDYFKIGTYSNLTDSQLANYMSSQYPNQCVEHGVIGIYTYDNNTRHVTDSYGGQYYYSGDWGYTTRNTCCVCNSPDVPFNESSIPDGFHLIDAWGDDGASQFPQCTEITDPDHFFKTQSSLSCSINYRCYSNLGLSCPTDMIEDNSSSATDCQSLVDGVNYDASTFLTENNFKQCCLRPVKPKFDCSTKGIDWEYNPSSTASTCSDWVDGVNYVSASFEEGSTISPTCCLKNMPDVNGTDSNDTTPPTDSNDTTPPTDNNDTTPPTDNNDTTPPTDSNDTTPPTDNNDKSNSDIIDSIHSSAETAHQDSASILDSITTISETAHQDSNDNLNAIQANGETNHNDLNDIKEILNEGRTDANNGLAGVRDNLDALVNTVQNGDSLVRGKFGDILSDISGSKPLFVGTGNAVLTANALNGTINIDLSILEHLAPYFNIIFMLLLAYINFKMYKFIITTIAQIGV